MTDDSLVVVATYASRAEADLAKSALEAAGIDALVLADDGGGMRPSLSWAGGGVQVIVCEEDREAAHDILSVDARHVGG